VNHPVSKDCPFCPANGKVDIIADTKDAYLVEAKNAPLAGCYLIVPKKHVTEMRHMPSRWQIAVQILLTKVPWYASGTPFNLSLNYGRPAGQTLEHLHCWVIPRVVVDSDVPPSYGKGLATLIKEADEASQTAS